MSRRCGGSFVASAPPMKTSPLSAFSRPAMTRRSVDLPLPLGPRSAVSDPAGTSRLTSSRATKSPKRLLTLRTVIAISWLAVLSGVEQVHQEQGREGDHRQLERRRVGRDVVEVLVLLRDPQRQRLGLADHVARDDGDRAVLADRAGGREDDAVDDAPADRREGDAAEGLVCARAERRRGLLLLGADLAQHRYHL